VRKLFKFSIFLLLFLVVVIPNSLQIPTAAMMLWCALLSLHSNRLMRTAPHFLLMHLAVIAITIIYIIVGQINNAPAAAVLQVIVIYILSPLLWLLIASEIFNRLGSEKLIAWLGFLSACAVGTVALFFLLFSWGGPDAVAFFKEDANVNLEDGYAAATMLVYGSLIFLTAGFFAAPTCIKSPNKRVLLLIALTIAAITSGRSALIIAIPIGILSWMVFRPAKIRQDSKVRLRRKSLIDVVSSSPLLCAVIAGAGLVVLASAYGVDVLLILTHLVEEIGEGGGSERADQFVALLKGTVDNWGLGAGHGVGLPDVVRNQYYPWRYEMVWAATLFRVGLLGSFVYALPFFVYLLMFVRYRRALGRSDTDLFFFAGFSASFLASNTNPYIESFAFQWMFVLPMVSLASRVSELRRARRALAKQNVQNTGLQVAA